jgi:nitroreductase
MATTNSDSPAVQSERPPADMPDGRDVVELMRRRRMHRAFEDRPVPKEALEQLAWAATRAQQARSGVRHVVIVDDADIMTAARQVLPGFINNAPAMLVHCTDVVRAEQVLGPRGVELTSRIDAGAACAHLALLAQTLGLGVCTVTSWTESAVQALLDLPDNIRPDVTVAVGYVPAKPPPPARGFNSRLYHNRFGTAFTNGDRNG